MQVRIETDKETYMIQAENDKDMYMKLGIALSQIVEDEEKTKLITINREEK